MRRGGNIVFGILGVLTVLLALVFGLAQTGFGKRLVLAQLESVLADPPARLQATSLEGVVPFAMRLKGVRLSDAQGVWLEADSLTLSWSPSALLGKRLRIDDLTADRIAVLRAPLSPPSQGASTPPQFPRLPVDIDLRRLQVERLELGPALLGEPAVFAVGAQARLGRPSDGLQASLHLKRTDRDNDTVDLDLDYRPEADTLKLTADAAEPQGGLVTQLLTLPGKPKFTLSLQGEGPLDHWQAKGEAKADDQPIMKVTASSTGAAADRKVVFDLTLPSLPMLPNTVAPLTRGGILAKGTIHLAGGGPIRIEALQLQTAAGTVTAQGDVDPAGPVDLHLVVALAGSDAFASLLPPDLGWSTIDAKIDIGGSLTTPKVALDGTAGNLAYAGNGIGKASLSLAGTLHTDSLKAEAVTASIVATGVTLADPKLQPLVAPGVTVDFAGALDTTGAIAADQLNVEAGSIAVALHGTATEWGSGAATLEGTITDSDLAPALAVAGMQGGGALSANAKITKQGEALTADLEATLAGARLGLPPVDAILAGDTKVKLTVSRDAGGQVNIETATIESPAARLAASGTMSAAQELDLKLDAALKDISPLLAGAKGSLAASAHVMGPIDNPKADVTVSNGTLTVDRFALADLRSTIAASDLAQGPKAKVALTGKLNGLPLSLAVDAALTPADGRIALQGLNLRLGTTSITGKATVIGQGAEGALNFTSADLAEIGTLVGQELHGSAEGTLDLHNAGGKQSATLAAKLKSVRAAGISIDAATIQASGANLLHDDPSLTATIAATGINAAGRPIDRLNAKASGSLSALAVSVDASGPNATASTAATIRAKSGETAITLAKLDLTLNQVQAKLLNPAEISLRGGETRVTGFAIGARGGTARLDAALTASGNSATLKLAKLPLSLLDAAESDLHMLGTLDGTLVLAGTKQAPDATVDLKGTGLGVQGASEQLADLAVKATWRGGALQANGRLDLSKSSALDFDARLPMAADPTSGFPVFETSAPLDARAQGKLDLGLANAFIPGGADHVAGIATVDLAAKGPLGQPILSGSAKIADGAYENQRYGTRLQHLTVDLAAEGSKLRVVSLAGTTPGGGTLGGSGAVDFGGAKPVDVEITMSKARMINAPIGTAITDGNIAFKGSLSDHVDLTGKVRVRRAEINIPDRLPPDVEEIQVVEVNASPARQAQLAVLDKPPPKSLAIGLDLTVDAPEQVFVRGRGLDAELGGKLQISGTADQPVITGDLDLRRGDFNLLSRRLEFTQGKITFAGSQKIDPVLDFTATTKIEAGDVTVTIGGTATKPTITLHSSPDLPQDEILAQLLFGKASGALSPFEAVQLAEAVSELSGVGGGSGTLDKFRKTLGLDRLNIESGEGSTTGPSLSAGRYVSRRVFVGAKQGTAANSSAATVEIEVTPNVKIESDVGADATGKAGINLEWNY